MPPPAKSPKVTVADLEATFNPGGSFRRFDVFERYSKQKPTADAIPVLRRALTHIIYREDLAVVRCAAVALRKLGPAAIEAMDDLFAAADKTLRPDELPQCYPECVEAMAAIQPSHPGLVPFIEKHSKQHNWVPISASLRSLKLIGTPEAMTLFDQMAAFWDPEFNKMQRRVVTELRAE